MKKKINSRIIRLIVLFLLLLIFYSLIKQEINLYSIKREKESLEKKIQTIVEQQMELNKKKQLLNDIQYIEVIAREQGMAKLGEIPYIVKKK